LKTDLHPLQQKKVCINRSVEVPDLPIFDIDALGSHVIQYDYLNDNGFERESYLESTIKLSAKTDVSDNQKKHSQQSSEALACKVQLDKHLPVEDP